MEPDVTKLRSILTKPFNVEADVLQFMVEVRKVDDLKGKTDSYKILKFFCDWLLHPDLTMKPAQDILKGLDDFIDDTKRGVSVEDKNIDFIEPLVSFRRLQHELAVFLTEQQLDRALVNGDEWFKFLSLYLDQIERTNVKSKDPATLGLKHIDRITIKKSLITFGPPAGTDQVFNFRVVWTLYWAGMQVFEIANELWSPKVPKGVAVPVLSEIIEANGTVKRVPFKATKFFGDKK